MRAALYIRVSTQEQAMHGLSLAAQEQSLRSYAESNKMRVVGLYADEGISARKPASKRPALQRLLNDVRSDLIDIILFIKLDRWFRNVAQYYKVQEVLDDHKVDWRCTQEDYDTTTANGRLKVNIMLSVAQDEADRTSERIRFVFNDKRARGEVVGGSAAFGLKIENKHYVPSKDAHIVKDMFDKFNACQNVSETQQYILHTHKKYISYPGIRVLLQNRNLLDAGVVSQESFNLASSFLANRIRKHERSGNVYIFNGLVYCAECGFCMSGFTSNHGCINYRCHQHGINKTCHNSKTPNQKSIEKYMIENLIMECEAYNFEISSKQEKRVDEAAIRRKMSKLKDLYLADLIDKDEYASDYKNLQSILDDARKIKKVQIDIPEMKSALSVYNELSDAGKKEFWHRVIKRIYVNDQGEISFEIGL